MNLISAVVIFAVVIYLQGFRIEYLPYQAFRHLKYARHAAVVSDLKCLHRLTTVGNSFP